MPSPSDSPGGIPLLLHLFLLHLLSIRGSFARLGWLGLSAGLFLLPLRAAVQRDTFLAEAVGWQFAAGWGWSPTDLTGGTSPAGEIGGTAASEPTGAWQVFTTGITGFDRILSGAGELILRRTDPAAAGTLEVGHRAGDQPGLGDFLGLILDVSPGQDTALVRWVLRAGGQTLQGDLGPLPLGTPVRFFYHYLPADRTGRPRLLAGISGADLLASAEIPVETWARAGTLTRFGLTAVATSGSWSVQADDLAYVTPSATTASPAWLAAAEERIGAYRRPELTVVVTDSMGEPLPGASVRVRQVGQEFGFGTAVNERWLFEQKGTWDNLVYRALIPVLFNKAVLENGHKWSKWEDPERRPMSEEAVDFLLGQGLTVRGHTLVWQRWDFLPADLQERQTELDHLRQRVEGHIDALAGYYRGTIREWDVVNEQFQENVLTDLLDGASLRDKSPSLAQWFQRAAAVAPGGSYYLNDFGILHRGQLNSKARLFETQIKNARGARAPVTGAGFQAHYWSADTRPTNDELWKILEKFAALGVDLQITEFDLYGAGWSDASQAEWAGELLATFFSHPRTVGFLLWGFWDGKQWQDAGPLFTAGWALKPSGEALLDLACRQWWTRVDGVTGADGRLTVPAYRGDYEIEITYGEHREIRRVRHPHAPEVNSNPFSAWPAVPANGTKHTYLGEWLDTSYPWIWSPAQGWWYLLHAGEARGWALDLRPELGWLYWDALQYPWFYSFGRAAWLAYVASADQQRFFYDPVDGGWLVVPVSGT